MLKLLTTAGLLLALLTGCESSRNAPPAGTPNVQADSGPADWRPLPAAPALDAATRAARLRLLGDTGEDPRQVKLWWVGVSSFVVSAGGHLFLLDAWEVVGVHKGYVPITRDDLVALKPEAIFIGHGHFDHAADAGYVANRTGAALIAGDSVCDAARADAANAPEALPFPCLRLGLDADTPVGTVTSVRVFADLPAVQVIKHTHSAADPASLTQGGMPLVYTPELIPYLTSLNTDYAETLAFLQSLPDDGGVGQPEGGTRAYHFRVGRFSLLWHDSTGEMPENDPHADAIRQALSTLPDCVDVQAGAIVGFGMVTSAYRDALAYVAAARPRHFLPNHHDAWFPVIGGGSDSYEAQWQAALASLPSPPTQDYLRDPVDYLKVRAFRVDDPAWAAGCR